MWPVPFIVVLFVLCACSEPAAPPNAGAAGSDTAIDPGPDLKRGELLGFACQACHALNADGGPDIGPSLHGVFGRRTASVPGFEYSEALANAEFSWTEERLDAWLQDPIGFLPGTSMAFAGYRDARDRASLIAWLKTATAADSSP